MPGSPGPSSQTVTQTNIPEYARPYFERLLDRTEGESNRGYTPYPGERLANPSSDTLAAQQGMRTLAQQGNPGSAAAMNAAANIGSFAPGEFSSGYQSMTYDPSTFGMMTAAPERGSSREFGLGSFRQYGSPFQQSVVDQEKRGALQDFNQQKGIRNTAAVKAGAFGGGRHAVENNLAENALLDRMTGIQTKGSQAAYENAQQQFERDQARAMGVQSLNIGEDMRAQLANQGIYLGTQQAGEQSKQFGATFTEGSRAREADLALRAAQMNEQARQEAARIGLSSADTTGRLATANQGNYLQLVDALNKQGTQMTADQQRAQDLAYSDFVNQRDQGRNDLGFYSSILRGVPISPNSETKTYDSGNNMSSLMGLGIGGLGLYRAMSGQ